MKNSQAYIGRIHGSYDRVLSNNQITVISGYGKLMDKNRVEVNGTLYSADHILIATGGSPWHPDIPDGELGIGSNGFFELQHLPKRAAVIGAGYIAWN